MLQIRETPNYLVFVETKGKVKILYRQKKDDPDKAFVQFCQIVGNRITYDLEGDSIKYLVLYGFDEPPEIINSLGFGFNEKAINKFLRYKLISNKYDTVIVAEEEPKKILPNELLLNLEDLEELIKKINQEQKACNDTKSILINNYLVDKYPDLALDVKETNNNKDLILRNLNSKLLDKLTAEEVERIGAFYVEAANKYSRPDIVKRMIRSLQKNTKLITLQEIIKIYNRQLEENPDERVWQAFFDDYITLFDNRYAHKVDYKNIAVGLTKYPDLVLVDIYGYVDFYELKKSEMPLLQYDKSHKTFYWSKEVSMVISQVSDYLQKARENAVAYAKTIKEETASEDSPGLEVNIIHPRAIVVAGRKIELNTVKKQNHFKNLRESLKDIEFVLYDELLDRMVNLMNSIKLS